MQNCVSLNKFSITIKKNGNGTLLFYNHSGDFDDFILNLFVTLFIKSSCVNELKYIKKSIKSSEIDVENKKYNTLQL